MSLFHTLTRLPTWGPALPLVLGASALAALLSGSAVTGDNPAVVQEPLTISASTGGARLVLSDGTATDLVIFNNDTSFAGAAETYPGDSYAIKLLLSNMSNADVIQRMTIDAPEGFTFDIAGGEAISVSQEQATTFLIRVDTGTNADGVLTNDNSDQPLGDELRIKIGVGPQVLPGFYRIALDMAQF